MKTLNPLIIPLILSHVLLFTSCMQLNRFNDQKTIKRPINWPKVVTSENDIKQYFENNIGMIDPIEGIYTVRQTATLLGQNIAPVVLKNYRIALVNRNVFKIPDEPTYDYIAIILESESKEWLLGDLKAYFRKTAFSNYYESKWFNYDFSARNFDFVIDPNGIIYERFDTTIYDSGYWVSARRETQLIRIYPNFKVNNSNNSNSQSKDGKLLKCTGSGFLLANTGLIVTNYHVVKEGTSYEVIFPIKNINKKARIRLKDTQNDIAILEIENFSLSEITSNIIPFSLAENTNVKVGQEVFTLGFPLGDIMGTTPRLATGTINSLYGLQDDPRLYQINNPIQPGNSGGALFNRKGELVGICVSSLSAKYFYENAGIIPQNVNFAIKGSYLKNLIGMLDESNEILNRSNTMKQSSLEDQVEQLNPYIVQVRVY